MGDDDSNTSSTASHLVKFLNGALFAKGVDCGGEVVRVYRPLLAVDRDAELLCQFGLDFRPNQRVLDVEEVGGRLGRERVPVSQTSVLGEQRCNM